MRPSKRAPDELRKVSLERGFSRYAEGSCLVKFGETHVLCTASLEERGPPWLRGTGKGWVTAEYAMLPRATHERTPPRGDLRQAVRPHPGDPAADRPLASLRGGSGGASARSRSPSTATSSRRMAARGLRPSPAAGSRSTTACSGCAAARWCSGNPLKDHVAAISCGIPRACRCSTSTTSRIPAAETDANFVMTGSGGLVEVQGTAEGKPFSEEELMACCALRARAPPG